MSATPDTTRHEYTDEEIIKALPDGYRAKPVGVAFLRAFLSALPALPAGPAAQPAAWPGQQEAIDAAFLQSDQTWMYAVDKARDWAVQEQDRLAIAQAYEAARPAAAEIAKLKAELEKAQQKIESLEFDQLMASKAVDNVMQILPELNTSPSWEDAAQNVRERIDRLNSELAALRQPWTPAVGDVVRLKSGGPVMTVECVDQEVQCVWSCSGEIQWTKAGGAGNSISAILARSTLPAACLQPVKEEARP